MPMAERVVVVTGVGLVNAAGIGAARVHDAVSRGESFLRVVPRLAAAGLPVRIGGEAPHIGASEAYAGRTASLVVRAADLALRNAELDIQRAQRDRVGVVLGQPESTFDDPRHEAGEPRARIGLHDIVARRYAAAGFVTSVAGDRASGAAALYFAARAIRMGLADVILAGGGESPLEPLAITCRLAAGELSTSTDPGAAYRPFDRDRSGYVLGEGAAVLVLEEASHARRRGAPVLGALVGASMATGAGTSASHALERAMRDAIARAPLDARRVDLVVAEGDASRDGDRVEARAIARVIGRDALATCTKGAYGHLLGASGATEAAIGLIAMQTRRVPPIAGLARADPDMPLAFVIEPIEHRTRTLLVNARGRHGIHVSLLFRDQP
jgi:3-oxoacyl-[acyl-carrier-protein] synthase II